MEGGVTVSGVVYFSDMRTKKGASLPEKVERMFKQLAMFKNIRKGELVAITLHFGERGNTGFIRPLYIRRSYKSGDGALIQICDRKRSHYYRRRA